MRPADRFGSAEEKDRYVRSMFNNISGRYDFLNHFLSAGIDSSWRRRAVDLSLLKPGESFLDIACGTGDVSLEAVRRKPARVVAVDFAENMLRGFDAKRRNLGLDGKLEIVQADAQELPFPDSTFDVAAVAFGARNFGNLEKGLAEMKRVLRKKGRIVVLEFSKPARTPVRQLYFFYFKKILPLIGKIVSRDGAAYSYLPDSVTKFPDGEEFETVLRRLEFKNVRSRMLSFGISTVYVGEK